MPEVNDDGVIPSIRFRNYNRGMRHPFVIYDDFECITEKIYTCDPKDKDSYMKNYQKHTPSGFCMFAKYCGDRFKDEIIIRTKRDDKQDLGMFMTEVTDLINDFYKKIRFDKPLIMSREKRKEALDDAKVCHIFKKELLDDKVLDHDHITGEFRGVAHNGCNLNYKIPKFFPVIFHNLAGYDAHLFIKSMGFTDGKIDCIPKNEDNYISFIKKIIVDTFEKEETQEERMKRKIAEKIEKGELYEDETGELQPGEKKTHEED